MPWANAASTSCRNEPPMAITGLLWRFATRATPTGVLPKAVCPSMRPSPVTAQYRRRAPARPAPHGLGHNFAARGRSQPAQKRKHCRAHAARCASAGQVCHVHAEIAPWIERKILQIAVELLHHLGCGPLCGPNSGGCATRAAQGIVHIAGNVNDASPSRASKPDMSMRASLPSPLPARSISCP